MNSTVLGLARSNAVLRDLSLVAIEQLLRLGETIEVRSQDTLVRQGELSDCAYLILDGELEVQVETAYGAVGVARVSRGALVGEIGVFTDLPRNATVRACCIVHALRFDRTSFLQAGNDNPTILRSIIRRLGTQIARFNGAIGLYTSAVTALEQDGFDVKILDELQQPTPELVDFAQHFRRMAEQLVRRRTQQAEMASAVAIQRAMLPHAQPASLTESQYDVFARMIPAREVGGDLYDLVDLGDDNILVTIGDVCGKGVPASLFMAVVQTVMRLTVRSNKNLQEEVCAANRLLTVNNSEDMFATLFGGILDLTNGTMQFCNCGHNPPLLLQAQSDTFHLLTAAGPPLGLVDNITYAPQSVTLARGDTLLLYTDGVTEAESPDRLQFGTTRLQRAMLETRGQSARSIVEHVVQKVTTFVEGASQSDDITCIVIARKN
jgi:serine phosphatase RsbU (regulator of sigma subunit)